MKTTTKIGIAAGIAGILFFLFAMKSKAVPKEECAIDGDCGNCEICSNGQCVDKVCPQKQVCNINTGLCVQPCYKNEFSDPKTINDFLFESGSWEISNDVLLMPGAEFGDRILTLKEYNFKDFNLTVKSRVLNDASPGAYSKYESVIQGIIFRHKIGANEGYSLELANGLGNATAFDVRLRNLANDNILFTKNVEGDMRNFHNYGIVVVGSRFTIFFEGEEIGEILDMSFKEGNVGFLNNHGHYEYDYLYVCEQ